MVDAADLKSVVRKDVRVRVPPWAPFDSTLQVSLMAGQFNEHHHFAIAEIGTALYLRMSSYRNSPLSTLYSFL
jgi:hypothetical protein